MIRGSLSLPPQMVNGGSPPTHLPSLVGSPLFPSSEGFPVAAKWMHPPARAPEWNGGGSLSDLAVLARRSEQEVIGLLEVSAKNAQAILELRQKLALINKQDARACQVARRQQLVNEEAARTRREDEAAARARQDEAARRQKLLDKQAARARQEAAARARQEETAARARQEEAARRQRAADARKTTAAQLIFLWLRRHRLYARLARQTSRRQQREAALARQHHEDECFARALQAEKQRMQVAAAQAKALADEAKERHRQAEVAIGEQRRQAAAAREKQAADDRRTAASAALALVEERCRQEALLAAEADVQRRHEEVLAAEAADVQRRHESAARATESDAAIERIRTEFALCAAPLDAILAEIACEEAAITTTLSPSRPTSYVDAVLFNMGGSTQPSLPLAGLPALPSPDVNSQRQTVRPRARPRRRTGRRNIPRAPSSYVAVAPTHPELLQRGLPTPTSITLAGATSPCCSVVSSTPPGWTTSHTPSLQSFTFDEGAVHTSMGGNVYPFHARGLPLPPWKRTRRKYRPHRTCRRHQPRAPNQSTGWA